MRLVLCGGRVPALILSTTCLKEWEFRTSLHATCGVSFVEMKLMIVVQLSQSSIFEHQAQFIKAR